MAVFIRNDYLSSVSIPLSFKALPVLDVKHEGAKLIHITLVLYLCISTQMVSDWCIASDVAQMLST